MHAEVKHFFSLMCDWKEQVNEGTREISFKCKFEMHSHHNVNTTYVTVIEPKC